MSKEKEAPELDVLEQVKQIEKAVKAKILIEKIAELKEFAREINTLKERSIATLEELGLSDKDIKRIVDYVNELPGVKLSKKDKEAIREEVSEEVEEQKEKVEKKLKDLDPADFFKAGQFGSGGGWGNGIASGTGYMSTSGSNNFTYVSSGTTANDNFAPAIYCASLNGGGDSSLMLATNDGESFSIKL